jgi:hypothetical protein
MSKYLIHWFPFCSGGFCDRILGLAGNLCIAKLLGRKLLLKWDHGSLSPNVTVKDIHNYYTYNVHMNLKYGYLNNHEMMEYFKTANIIAEWGDDNIMFWSNVNLYNYIVQNPYFDTIDKENRVKNLSDSIQEVLFNYLELNPKLFEDCKKYDAGIHIRTGDKQIYNKHNEEFYRDYITNIFKKIKADNNIKEHESIFISSDCLLTFKIASEFFDNFNYNEGDIVHTSNEITDSGVYKVLLDLLTLCNCKSTLYIGWNSNFSRIASLFNINRKIICYEYENNPEIFKEVSAETLFEYHSLGKYT